MGELVSGGKAVLVLSFGDAVAMAGSIAEELFSCCYLPLHECEVNVGLYLFFVPTIILQEDVHLSGTSLPLCRGLHPSGSGLHVGIGSM